MGHHHSEFPFGDQFSEEQINKMLNDMGINEAPKTEKGAGPLGTFPDGKLAPNDEGAIAIAFTVIEGRLVMDFGKPIRTIGFTKDEAVGLANYLFEKAKSI